MTNAVPGRFLNRRRPGRPAGCSRAGRDPAGGEEAPYDRVVSISRVLDRMRAGDARAADELLPLVYAELRQMAARQMAREGQGRTLQATALVHEAWLELVGDAGELPSRWDSRGHFFGAAARAMRQILVERARARAAAKRGGGRERLALEDLQLCVEDPPIELIDLDVALERFGAEEPIAARLVELRFFGGLTQAEAASALGLAATTADRHWTYARAWLYHALGAADGDPDAAG